MSHRGEWSMFLEGHAGANLSMSADVLALKVWIHSYIRWLFLRESWNCARNSGFLQMHHSPSNTSVYIMSRKYVYHIQHMWYNISVYHDSSQSIRSDMGATKDCARQDCFLLSWWKHARKPPGCPSTADPARSLEALAEREDLSVLGGCCPW